jgi:hypothetical protein
MKRRSFNKVLSCFILVLLSAFLTNAFSQQGITAIDVLLDPDQTMLDSAKSYNQLMQRNYSGPGSYSLDALHTPHITVLQCFVSTSDLDKVYAAVSNVVKHVNPTKESLSAKGLYYFPYKNLGLAGITIDTTQGLMHFQSGIIEALKPFIVEGNLEAFVKNADGTPVAAPSKDYVNGFIADHAGAKYNPHVTIGLAHEDYLKGLLAQPFKKFTFKCASVSIYHLGDFGTARTKLWTSSK